MVDSVQSWIEFGAGDRIRTGDIDLGKVALYQLSYSRAWVDTHFLPETFGMSNVAIRLRKCYSYIVGVKLCPCARLHSRLT